MKAVLPPRLSISGPFITSLCKATFILWMCGCTCARVAVPPPKGLARNELHKTVATIRGQWSEEDLFFNQSSQWTGSCFFVEKSGDTIRCLTNAHCLSLEELANADSFTDGIPDLISYSLVMELPSGKERKILKIAPALSSIDVAWIEISAEGLQAGVDYLLIADGSHLSPEIGNAIVAVGSPHGLKGTHTFGKISALRSTGSSRDYHRLIQHDAAINPGNSGGPLFLDTDNGFFCVGMNSARAGQEGLGFAIRLEDCKQAKCLPVELNLNGIAQVLKEKYGKTCVISPKAQ